MEMADKKRRKSLRNVFKRPESPLSIPSMPSSPVEKRTETFWTESPNDSDNSGPRIRPRTLQKSNRTSVFGSLRSTHSMDEDEKANLTRIESKASSLQDEGISPGSKSVFGEAIIQHGEIQIAGGTMFRKRSLYVVLTETHLVRFKNQSKAIEAFPSLSGLFIKTPLPRSSTMSSIGSFHDLQMSAHADATQAIPLEQVVAVYRLDDGRPFFTIEVSYLDERSSKSSAMQLQFSEPREASSWTSSIRNGATYAREKYESVFQNRTINYIARVLESQRDYDPMHFQVFKVVQLSSLKSTGKSSSDDFAKANTSVCYFAIGINKVHFIPVTKTGARSSLTSLTDCDSTTSLGLVTMTSIKLQSDQDILQLQFRSPLGQAHNAVLASCYAHEIVMWLRFASEYIRPEWTMQSFTFDVPQVPEESLEAPSFDPEDHNCFDRTLIAYCAAYGVDTTRIVYTVDYECEDAPCFRLLPSLQPPMYTSLELLAVFRALRYNEFFVSLSFANIDLRPLRDLYSLSDPDIDGMCTRSGAPAGLADCTSSSVLTQEIRALALKSRRLRRLDFTNAMSKPLKKSDSTQSSGIPEAIAPLSKKSLTNVDWVILNGIQLGDSDLDHLVDAASERRCHFRALEVGDCGLSVHDIDVILSTLAVHNDTVEVINVSAPQGRFSPELFQRGIGAFSHIRRLDLTRVQKTAGPEPLIAPEVLLGWRLESLHLSHTTLNEQTIDAVSMYLASDKSETLRELHINQCGLTGNDLAVFLRAMTRQQGVARDMHVNANDNRLGVGISAVSKCLAKSHGPASLGMRMLDFEKEHHFRELVEALTSNTTLRSLDLSRASLPYDAGEDTCQVLKDMLAINDTLEELDISGEHAHLDAARFGIGLNIALLGLESNTRLKSLRIEHQNLGLQGASTLAGVLEVNRSLLEIHCEHNGINLQSFTVLVNALQKNTTLLYMPTLEPDRAKSMGRVKEEFEMADRMDDRSKSSPRSNNLRKGMGVLSHKGPRSLASHHRKSSSMASSNSFTEQDVTAAIGTLDERWQSQVTRMQGYLERNYQLASGQAYMDDGVQLADYEGRDHDGRPGTAESLGKILARVKLDRTPTVERGALLDAFDEKMLQAKRPMVFQLPED